MLRRWHHGHSLGAGTLAGLALASYRVWLLLALAFLLGVVLTVVAFNARAFARWVGRSTSPLTMRKWKALRRRVNDLRPDDPIPY